MNVDALKKRIEDGKEPERGIPVQEAECVVVTAAELREAAVANPDHPVAGIYQKAVHKLPDSHEVTVEKLDLLGLIDNKAVHLETGADGVKRKRLGDSLGPKPVREPTATKPAATPKEAGQAKKDGASG